MSVIHVECKVRSLTCPERVAVVSGLVVDETGTFTWIPEEFLQEIGLEPVKRGLRMQLASGEIVVRDIGFAILSVGNFQTVDEVVFAQDGDRTMLGARALEGMNVRVDKLGKCFEDAGPAPAVCSLPHEWLQSKAAQHCALQDLAELRERSEKTGALGR